MDKNIHGYRERISVEEAADCIMDFVMPVAESEEVPLLESMGRIVSKDMRADLDNPPFDRAPVDGYACRACDTAGASSGHPVKLQVVVEINAGQFSMDSIGPGQAVRIMTGAAIPEGCDCCIRQEDTDYGESEVEIYRELKPHDNYCDKGEDFRSGTLMVKQGEKISYVEVGNLAAMGCSRVPVYRKPRIALFTTGDEVTLPGQPLLQGKIYNSNYYLLAARLKTLGVEPMWTDSLMDDREQVAGAIQKAVLEGADLIITTGGVSVGKKDIIHDSLERLGARKIFWKVKLKPGTPTVFSIYRGIPVISLSGNPFGAITNVELIIRPVLAKMTGDPSLPAAAAEAVMADAFPKASQGRRFIRAACRAGKVYLPDGLHSSGVLSSMKGCNCLVDIAPGTLSLEAGDRVKIWML